MNHNSIEVISEDRYKVAFDIIKSCAEDLEKQGLTHWSSYYSDVEKFKESITERNGEVYIYYIDGIPAATFTFATTPPNYFTEPEIKPVTETGEEVDNLLYFFTPVEEAGQILYPTSLAVLPNFQGQGIGRKIM